MPDDVSFTFAVFVLFLAALAVVAAFAHRHGGRRGVFLALAALLATVAIVVLVSGP